MLIQSGEMWRCTDPACRSELSVGLSRELPGDQLLCACGGVMKKHYTSPVFRYLDFIGERPVETSLLTQAGRESAPARKD
jgi:hypothetical protein